MIAWYAPPPSPRTFLMLWVKKVTSILLMPFENTVQMREPKGIRASVKAPVTHPVTIRSAALRLPSTALEAIYEEVM